MKAKVGDWLVMKGFTIDHPEQRGLIMGFPRNRGGFLYAASGWMAAIFSYSTGGSNPAELWRRRVL